MASRIKENIRPWVPPKVLDLWRKSRGTAAGLKLVDGSWSDPENMKGGYRNPLIVESVTSAAREAITTGTGFERDGLFFDAEETYWPVLGPLFEARSSCSGKLRVIDFGGSLASKWLQHRRFLTSLAPLSWMVVEQPHYVEVGRQLLADEDVSFCTSFEAAVSELHGVDIVIFSSSLHYSENPMRLLDQAIDATAHSVVIDRSPAWLEVKEHLALQTVGLYSRPVQYPCWVLSQPTILDRLRRAFEVVATWTEALPMPTEPQSAEVVFFGASGMVKSS
jgi:putative methyltransferase (TIGR04325 family)